MNLPPEVELKEFLERLISDQRDYFEAKFTAQQLALDKASFALEKRLDAMNEMRDQLNRQATTFMTRDEYAANHKNLEDKLAAVNDRLNRTQGKEMGSDVTMGKLYTALSAVVAVITMVVLVIDHIIH